MPVLTLLRHAKAAQPLPGQKDFDRPLTERGRNDAGRMGALLADLDLGLALVSSAARTQETWELAVKAVAAPIEPTIEQSLYLCRSAHLIKRLREIPPEIQNVVVVGHNPGIQEVALWLAGKQKISAVKLMREKFPTAAMAIFEIESVGWDKLAPEHATLKRFVAPRNVDID